ncbi:MAG TPA: PAS domain S-box protein [Candidatus Limnocylindrales bacterium]|jgi:PAS domain S-box-containing protein
MSDRRSFAGPGASSAFLAAIVDSAEDAITGQSLDGTVLSWNAAATRMFGYTAEEMVGNSVDVLVPHDRLPEIARISRTIAAGERLERFETVRVAKSGRRIEVSLTVSPILALDGRVIGASSIARDIGERSRFLVESQRAERLDVASRLARGIARELVDLVTAIQGHASLVLEDLADDPRTRASAEAVRRATEQAAVVAHQLLALSGEQVLAPRAIDLNKTIASSLRLLGDVAGRATTIELELDPLIPDVLVDPDQLDHVLVGLVAASRDRLGPGGRITLSTRPGTSGAGVPDVVLTVRDNGSAIPLDQLDEIFEPFPGSGRPGDGNLWLATAHGILNQSGGSIRADTGPDGTTFTVRLPAHAAAPRSVAESAIEPLPRGTEWILVVEDEDGVRDFIERALERLGYHVTAVASGEDALERVRGYFADPIDLLVTDVVLPGMSGPELASTLEASRPGLPVLYVSGYASDVTAFHGLPGLADHVLAKPFGMDVLARRVRSILEDRARRAQATTQDSTADA